jgi:hypothetical protein
MKIGGSAVTPVITGTPKDYTLTYTPPVKFNYADVISVSVDAKDLISPPNVMTTKNYSFTVQGDTTVPYISGLNPARNQTGVPINAVIIAHILEVQNGTDISTIVMKVNGAVVTPVITGTAADYTLTYTPLTVFTYGQVVTVTIDAKDLSVPSNAMQQQSYQFTCEFLPATHINTGQVKVVGSEKGRGVINPDKGDTAKVYFSGTAAGTFECKIFTLNGKLVWNATKQNVQNGYFDWSATGVASGTYIVSVTGPGVNQKNKIVILR